MTSRERMEAPEGTPPVPPAVHGARFESVADVAARLSCSEASVRRAVKRGDLTAVKVGRIIRVRVDLLDEQLRHDPGAGARQGRTAARTTRPPRARAPRGRYARMARGLPVSEAPTPVGDRP